MALAQKVRGWPASPPELTDGVVRLRAWRAGDADAVTAACQDAEIQRWTSVPAPYLLEHAAHFVGPYAAQEWSSGQGGPLAVVTAGDDVVVGACGIVRVDLASGVAELGYWTAPSARGRGFTRRAVTMLADWARREAGFELVELHAEEANVASRRVAETSGFVLDGMLRRAHRGRPDVVFQRYVRRRDDNQR